MDESTKVVMTLAKTAAKLTKSLDRCLSLHGISFSEYLVLNTLSQEPSKTMSRIALAESINLTASGVTRMLNPMEKLHLIEKEKNVRDARISLVKLSETGEEVYRDATTTLSQRANSQTAGLDKGEIKQLVRALGKIN